MPLSATQQTVANCDKRFRVVIAGRRWGKTTLAIREMCKIAREPGKDVYYISPTYRMSRTIIFKRLKEKLLDLRWVKKINETNLEFLLKNGSTISLKGADNPDSLRGVSLSAAIFDEFAFMDSETWDLVIRPALADQQGSALFITTPVGKNNWAFDLFNMQQQHPDTWASFQYTTLQGGFVPEQEVEAARSEMTAQQFQQEFEASFVVGQSLVAWEFDRKDHVKELDNPNTAVLHVGMDFNVSPITAAIFVQKGDIMWQIDEIVMQNSNTQELSDELIRRYPQSRITCYPDPAGRQRKTSAGGQTDFTILQNAGFSVKAPNSHNPVRDGVNAVNSMLCSAGGQRRFFVDPRCKRLIECLERHNYKPGTTVPDKDAGYDHLTDAARYYFDYVFPVRREVIEQPPQRWGHAIALGA
jgi:PBSX family phage terminase large subunit